jgi:hypothetical protein
MYSPALQGQLAFDGARYGAYFAIRAGVGSPEPGVWSDQLSYANDEGTLLDGGWGFGSGCSDNCGLRIQPEPGAPFAAACFSDDTPQTGLNWMTEGQPQHLAFEESWDGYVAGQFGSLVDISDGTHLVVWSSRGDGGTDAGTASGIQHPARAQDAPDIAMLHVGQDGAPLGPVVWLTDTPNLSEIGVHVAPYGKDRYLLLWSTIAGCNYINGNCYGTLVGTYVRIIDAEGHALTSDELIPAWAPDNSNLVLFPNQDVGWAFVNLRPSYTQRIDVASAPAASTVRVARMKYCP